MPIGATIRGRRPIPARLVQPGRTAPVREQSAAAYSEGQSKECVFSPARSAELAHPSWGIPRQHDRHTPLALVWAQAWHRLGEQGPLPAKEANKAGAKILSCAFRDSSQTGVAPKMRPITTLARAEARCKEKAGLFSFPRSRTFGPHSWRGKDRPALTSQPFPKAAVGSSSNGCVGGCSAGAEIDRSR